MPRPTKLPLHTTGTIVYRACSPTGDLLYVQDSIGWNDARATEARTIRPANLRPIRWTRTRVSCSTRTRSLRACLVVCGWIRNLCWRGSRSMGSERVNRESERLSASQYADTIDRLVTAVIRGDEFQLHLERELLEHYESLLAEVVRLRTALRTLEQWDMLTLDKDGHGVATADAPWARALIAAALGEDE